MFRLSTNIKTITVALCLVCFLCLTSCQANNQPSDDPLDRPIRANTPSAIPLNAIEVKPGLFFITGRGANAAALRTSEGIILVDNKVQYNLVWRELKQMLKKKVADKPIKYAFITHHHADHGGLNQQVIDSGAELIGHENVIETLKNYTSAISPFNPAPPTITFKDRVQFELGGKKVIAYHWGTGHTHSDIAVYFPDEKVIAAGDILYGNGYPSVDAHHGHGSILEKLKRIDDLLAIDFEIALPGHGVMPMSREDVIAYKKQLSSAIRIAKEAIKAGLTPEQMVKQINESKTGLTFKGHFWRTDTYLRPIYEELKASVE